MNPPAPTVLSADEVLIFIHIFKTGGNTLTRIIERQFDPRHVFALRGAEILQLPQEELRKYRYLTGHYPYSVYKLLPSTPVFITMLRDPVDRVLSLYGYARSHAVSDNVVHSIAQTSSIDEFVHHERIRTHISDVMTLFLAAEPEDFMSRERPMTVDDLELAVERLKTMTFVGLTERFDESLFLLRSVFAWADDSLVSPVNVTPHPVMRREVSRTTIRKIEELNKLDMSLYGLGRDIFEQRLHSCQ